MISALREQSWDCWHCRQLPSAWLLLPHWGWCGSCCPDWLTSVVLGVCRGTGGSHPQAVERERVRSTLLLLEGVQKMAMNMVKGLEGKSTR